MELPNVSYAIDTMKVYYNPNSSVVEEWYSNYMTIESLEDGLTATFNMADSSESVEYCIDNGDWMSISSGEETQPINQGQMMAFRGALVPVMNMGMQMIGMFSISKECNLKGNCMSLLFGNDAQNHDSLEGYDGAFCGLFVMCTTIKEVDSKFLPATTLANGCYYSMFQGCTSLVTAPTLPATTLADYCYRDMFYYCDSLVLAPELLATELAEGCYYRMFNGCRKLNNITMLATDISASSCLYNWVDGVASTGTFIKAASMTSLPSGASGIPNGWIVKDYVG